MKFIGDWTKWLSAASFVFISALDEHGDIGFIPLSTVSTINWPSFKKKNYFTQPMYGTNLQPRDMVLEQPETGCGFLSGCALFPCSIKPAVIVRMNCY